MSCYINRGFLYVKKILNKHIPTFFPQQSRYRFFLIMLRTSTGGPKSPDPVYVDSVICGLGLHPPPHVASGESSEHSRGRGHPGLAMPYKAFKMSLPVSTAELRSPCGGKGSQAPLGSGGSRLQGLGYLQGVPEWKPCVKGAHRCFDF